MEKKRPLVTFRSKLCKLEHLNGAHYIVLGPAVLKKAGGLRSRLICILNNKIRFQCGPVPWKNGSAYISVNAKRIKELDAKTGESVDVALLRDESKYGFNMPAELAELLRQDGEGSNRFKKLAPGKQRYIIYYVLQVKSPELRLERALRLITNLKSCPEGKESFASILGKAAN